MIDVAPIEMPAAGDEVQLIAEVVVGTARVEMEKELHRRKRGDEHPGRFARDDMHA
jgi:hypothetical protein